MFNIFPDIFEGWIERPNPLRSHLPPLITTRDKKKKKAIQPPPLIENPGRCVGANIVGRVETEMEKIILKRYSNTPLCVHVTLWGAELNHSSNMYIKKRGIRGL